jgi:hypothetical protein
MERLRLMCWCQTCVSGLHLPAFAAAEGGLFAEQGLEVEFVDCPAVPDVSLAGWSTTVKAVAGGGADFALSSVAYLLAAQAEADGRLAARFAAVFHQRNPIAALVANNSDLREPDELPGRRMAGWPGSWFVEELEGAVAQVGLDPLAVVDAPADLLGALGRGEIDVVPGWVDMTPGYSKSGLPVRAIPLDLDGYATGLVAADRLPLERVSRMRDALAAGYELQREEPELGISAFRRRFPSISEEHLRAGWSVLEPYVFDGPEPGVMDAARWRQTIESTAARHDLPVIAAERVYRPELLPAAVEYAAA